MITIIIIAICVLVLINSKGGAAKSGTGAKKAKAKAGSQKKKGSEKKKEKGKEKSGGTEYKTGSNVTSLSEYKAAKGDGNYSAEKQHAKDKGQKPGELEKKVQHAKSGHSEKHYHGSDKVYTKKKGKKIYKTIKGSDGIIYVDFRSDEDRKSGKHIDDIVGEGHTDEKKVTKTYDKIDKKIEALRRGAPEVSDSESRKNIPRNLVNMVKNAIDFAIGPFISEVQNNHTLSYLKKHPDTKKKIVYLARGVEQNIGNGWRLGHVLEKNGYLVFHLHQDHNLPREKNAESNFKQITDMQKYTKLKDPAGRNDLAEGHSSGADILIYMAADKKISKIGIKNIQAVAPMPYGLKKAETTGQKILIPFVAKHDNAATIEGKLNAIEMSKRKPIPGVNVYILAGSYDRLVRPKDAVYEHAKAHNVIEHPDSTHFGTSGANSYIIKNFLVPHIKSIDNGSNGDIPGIARMSHKKIYGKAMEKMYHYKDGKADDYHYKKAANG